MLLRVIFFKNHSRRVYIDVRQKPCQFYWHGLLRVTIDLFDAEVFKGYLSTLVALRLDL